MAEVSADAVTKRLQEAVAAQHKVQQAARDAAAAAKQPAPTPATPAPK